MPELSTDPSYGLTRRASQVSVVQSCQRAISHYTAMLQSTIVELGEDVPFDVRRYVGDEIALALSLSPWTGRDLVEEAMLMSLVPSVWGLMSDGTLSAAHARKMVGPLRSLTREDCARVLDLVLPKITGKTPHQLGQLVEAAVLCLDLQAAEDRREQATKRRDVQSWPSKDGQAALYATGPVEQVAAMIAALDAMTWPRQPDDDRTAAQRRFDLLVDLVTGGAQPGQWEAQIIVPIDTATGAGEQLAVIPGFGEVLPSVMRETVAKAGLRRLAVDSITGQLLAVDDKVHRPDRTPEPASGSGASASKDRPRPAAEATPERRPSAETEPEPVTDTDEHPIDNADQAWGANDNEAEPDPVANESNCDTAGINSDAEPDPADADADADADISGPGIGEADVDPVDAAAAAKAGPDTREPVTDGADTDLGDELDSEIDAEIAADLAAKDLSEVYADQDAQNSRYNAEHDLEPTPVLMLTPGPVHRPHQPRSIWSEHRLQQVLQQLRLEPLILRDLSTDRYALPRKLRRFLNARDLTCTFPGCGRHARRCEKDHVVPWPRGTTSADNLTSECKHHHLAKHAYFSLTRLPDGTMRWTTPAGLSYDRPPRSLLG